EAALRTPFPLTPPALGDEFYPFGGERQQTFGGDVAAGDGDPEEADLGVLLQRKEQDLLLAAELGKMLLERNEELERRFEELAKEHMETKERLEQEKHELRLHLESRSAEFETRVAELETDLATVRAQLGQKRMEQQDTSRESSQAVLDLSEQNQRLVEQLSQVRGKETQQEGLAGKSAAPTILFRKRDLEKQTHQLREENESIQALVDTLHNNLLLLRNESREKELRVEVEAEELRASNRRLQHQVKEMKEEIRLHDLDTSVTSIQSEIESSLEDAPGAPGKAPKVGEEGSGGGGHLSSPVCVPGKVSNAKRRLLSMCQFGKLNSLSRRGQACSLIYLFVYVSICCLIRKGEMELELAKVSLERDSMSQQLLRVIRQKMALSQELEAWQDDIQYIIHQQLLQKHQEETHPIASSPRSPAEGKNPPFYRRGTSIPNGTGFFSLFRKS
uniref:BICD family-like cargo adapter 2 n=1 Tax=Podarcis muralis TaxID=64176 RepID=A0A670JCT1_PODMU